MKRKSSSKPKSLFKEIFDVVSSIGMCIIFIIGTVTYFKWMLRFIGLLSALFLCCPSIPAKPTNETLNFLKTLPNSTNYIREYNQHGPPGTNRVQRINPTPIK